MDLEKKIKNVKVYVEDDDKMTNNRQISIRKAHLSLRLEFLGVFFCLGIFVPIENFSFITDEGL